ncbi:MAG TPA: phasin family protein [Sphingomicrobium sp.]|nr:phasin family protein [Sphingomicrobium sp.]
MADETQVEVEAVAKAAAEAPAKVAGTIADTIETIAEKSAKVAKRTRATAARRAKRVAAANEAAIKTATKAATRRTARKPRKVAAKASAATKERTQKVTKTAYNGFEAVPAFAPFQTLLNEANERGQEFVKRGQKVAEELADLARANVEAVVEAGRVASEGARSIGQDVVAKQRDSFEQAADAIRSLAEAKSPTEYLQLQGDFARASFDRAVAETSKLTESLVKLAGEAFQPLSNRASANAERFNTLVA